MNKSISGAGKQYIVDFSVIIALHTAVRLIVYSKTSFVWNTINNYMQYLDPVILRHNLLVGLRDLHIQPPLFNAFLGVILKLFPDYPGVFSAIYFLTGLAISCLSYLICMHLTKRRLVSIAAACIIASFPPLLQADRWLFYVYPITLLLLCACFFIIHSQKNTGMQIFFIVICATMVLARSFFHLIVWLVPAILLVVFLSMRFKRRALVIVLAVSLLVWILSSVPYFRNYIRYGMFTGSTFQGFNLAGMVRYVGEKDIENMISRGRITPLARIKRFSEPKVYFAYFDKKPRDDSPVLGAFYRLTGDINWNNEIYATASKEYQRNTLELIKEYPGKYLKAIVNELYIFFGTEPYRFFGKDDEWPKFRKDSVVNFISDAGRLAGIPFLIFGMCAAALAGFILRISRDVKRYTAGEIIESRRCEIFILFNLIYTLLTANLLEFGEGCFMRMSIDPFLIIGAAVFITDNVPGFGEICGPNTCGEASIQKKTFGSRLITSGVAIFFAGLCAWNTYVVFHGPSMALPGTTRFEDYNGKAAEERKQAIRINPQNAEAYCNLGVIYGKCGRYNEAIKALRKAIRINPDYGDAYYYLGVSYNAIGHWNKAVKTAERAIYLNAADAEAYYVLGEAYSELERYHEAIDAFKRAIQIKPDYGEAHYSLGRVYLILGDSKAALNEQEILKDLDRNIKKTEQSGLTN